MILANLDFYLMRDVNFIFLEKESLIPLNLYFQILEMREFLSFIFIMIIILKEDFFLFVFFNLLILLVRILLIK